MKNIWVPVSGAIAQQHKVDTIANNVANANTPGFKRDQLVFKEHLTAFSKGIDQVDLPNKEWKPSDFYHSYGAENSHVKVDGNYIDFSQGQLAPTQNPLDIAINGKGFFEVQSQNGIRYTRKGNFTISNDGILVTDQGYPVLSKINQEAVVDGEASKPEDRYINIGSDPDISITFSGEIYQKGQKIGELSVVQFDDVHALKKEGSAMFINNDIANISKERAQTSVRQGFIEQSNVNAVGEMSSLIQATRHFQSIQKALKAYDNIAQKGVNQIAKF